MGAKVLQKKTLKTKSYFSLKVIERHSLSRKNIVWFWTMILLALAV